MKRQVVRLWTCLLFLAFLFPVSLRAELSFNVKEISGETRTQDRLAFVIAFTKEAGKFADITNAARAKFSFVVTYDFGDKKGLTSNLNDTDAARRAGTEPFMVTSGTRVDEAPGLYNIEIKIDTSYSGANPPKNFSELGQISIEIQYDGKKIGSPVLFKENKNLKYYLGNKVYVANLLTVPEYQQVVLTAPGSRDEALLFKHEAPGNIKKLEDKDEEKVFTSSQKMDLIVLSLEGIDNQTDYNTNFTDPGEVAGQSFPISSRALSLLDPATGARKVKPDENELWSTFVDSNMQAAQETECYFVFPKAADIAHGKQYECVRCNFANSAVNSTDKVYLLDNSSFSGKENVIEIKKSMDVSTGPTVENIENDKFYAVLPLFSDGTMIYYNKAKSSQAASSSNTMCKIISPRIDYTLLEFLNGGNQDNTEKGDPRCFIVSAAYGSSFEPQVDIFRWLRDRFILQTSWGEKLMDFYYENSEPVANFIASSEVLKFSVRTLLWPFALGLHLLKFLLETPFLLSLLGVFLVSLFLLKTVFVSKT